MAVGEPTVGELGEGGVLRRVLSRLEVAEHARLGPGDDCAVLSVSGDLVVTTDTMIEGGDFRLDWHSGFELGWKLAATNLSDVAAMGARPTALTLALAVPASTPVSLLEEIAEGLNAGARTLAPGCGVVGGDLARAPAVTAAITALGHLEGRSAVTRSGASSGDVVAYAGDLGLSGLGLDLLYAESRAAAGADSSTAVVTPAQLALLWQEHPVPLAAHLAPTPPITLGVVAAGVATAMMDVSDSLSLDAHRLANASGVTIALSSELLMREFGEQEGVAVPLRMMLTGGEDHGLLATFPAGTALPDGFKPIGSVAARSADDPPLLLDGAPLEAQGWDPFTADRRS